MSSSRPESDPLARFRDIVIAAAFKSVPGQYFNEARRQFTEQDGGVTVLYELTIPEAGSWEEFRDKTFPLLAKYLYAQGLNPEYPRSVVITAFYRDKCYFIEATKFFAAFKEIEGLNSQAFHFRVLQWLHS
ncbi:MAG: STAUR_1299 family protein [Verrucomicrobiae bacterium]|nr:STAUR_1299 family protein [Verrucomicrobiae bacterium]MCX7722329.1 STAUR_1299 family protein [Verrucomicrobiae bacterium]MDW7979596.1 STAUR_1299 family protein [Verrucomicrobiales bacterium]